MEKKLPHYFYLLIFYLNAQLHYILALFIHIFRLIFFLSNYLRVVTYRRKGRRTDGSRLFFSIKLYSIQMELINYSNKIKYLKSKFYYTLFQPMNNYKAELGCAIIIWKKTIKSGRIYKILKCNSIRIRVGNKITFSQISCWEREVLTFFRLNR